MTAGLTPYVYEHDGAVYADSRDVAAFFGKRHEHVLRDIDNILKTNNTQNWVLGGWFTERTEARPADNPGRPFRRFELTKDGFTLLAMGFTGEKALAFKIAYIERFNRMEALLRAEAVAALSAEQVAELVDRRVGELLRDQRAVLAEGFVTANDIRAQHVAGEHPARRGVRTVDESQRRAEPFP